MTKKPTTPKAVSPTEILAPETAGDRIVARPLMTRARTDDALVGSWLDGLNSQRTRKNFGPTAAAFLAALDAQGLQLRTATVEDVRDAINVITAGKADSTARQYVLRVKSLLSYAQKLGYLQLNPGAAIKVQTEARRVSKRTPTSVEISLLIRSAPSKRDRIMLQVIYAAGLRVAEAVGLDWSDVIERGDDRVQLSVIGKGGKVREILLPAIASRILLSLRDEAEADGPVFRSRQRGRDGSYRLSERMVNVMIKKTATAAGVNPDISAHWLRHGAASHALDGGATLAEVQESLGHANVATTSGYLHARPGSSLGDYLDQGVFLR